MSGNGTTTTDLWRCAFLALIACLLMSMPARAETDARLLGQWPLAEDAQDASGNGRHGRLLNGAVIRDGVLNLDGVSAFVWFGNSREFTPTGSFSYAVWIAPEPESPPRINRVLGKIATPDQKEYCALLDAQQRLWVFLSGTGSEKAEESILRVTSEPVRANAGGWVHLAVTWDPAFKADGVRVYVNGAETGTQVASSGVFDKLHSGSADLCLGAFDIENAMVDGNPRQIVRNPFKGRMSDFRLYAGVLPSAIVAGLAANTPNKEKTGDTGDTRMVVTQPIGGQAPNSAKAPSRSVSGREFIGSIDLAMADAGTLDAQTELLRTLSAVVAEVAGGSSNGEWSDDELLAAVERWFRLDRAAARSWIAQAARARETHGRLSLTLRIRLAAIANTRDWLDLDEPTFGKDQVAALESAAGPNPQPVVCAALARLWAGVDAGMKTVFWGETALTSWCSKDAKDPAAGLRETGRLYAELHLTPKTCDSAVTAVLSAIQKGSLAGDSTDYWRWARLCMGPQAKTSLEGVVRDSDGAPRIPVAVILAWMALRDGAFASWKTQMEEWTKAGGAGNKTQWLVVAAYGEEIRLSDFQAGPIEGDSASIRRYRLLREAWQLTEDPVARERLLWEWKNYYCSRGQPGVGYRELGKLASGMPGLPAVLDELQRADTRHRSLDAQTHAEVEKALKRAGAKGGPQ